MEECASNERLWSLWEVADAIGAQCPPECEHLSVTGVQFDSRQVRSGDLFIALNEKAHRFVAPAFHNGAVAAVLSCKPLAAISQDLGPAVLAVENGQKALEALGVASRKKSGAKFVAVTGSVGKTTTKEAIATLLGHHSDTVVYKSPGNFNNHIGVPFSLANMPLNVTHGVFEMGMSAKGEIKHLTSMVEPHVALITKVGSAHAEFFDSIEDIVRAKAEIFEAMTNGVAILPRDSLFYSTLLDCAGKCSGVQKILTFGRHPDSDIVLEWATEGLEGTEFSMKIRLGSPPEVINGFVKGAALHEIENLAGVFAVICAVDINLTDVLGGLEHLSTPKRRGNVVEATVDSVDGQVTLIDSTYNANPLSMKAALKSIKNKRGRRKVAILADMLELGPSISAESHKNLLADVQQSGIDQVVTVGKDMQNLWNVLPETLRAKTFADVGELLNADPAEYLKGGDVVLVKGSGATHLKRWFSKYTNYTSE